MRHGIELARRSENELGATFNAELSRAVRHAERRSEAVQELISMHKRHGDVVSRVLEQQIHENAPALVEGTLDPTCLLAMVATRRHLSANYQALAGVSQFFINRSQPPKYAQSTYIAIDQLACPPFVNGISDVIHGGLLALRWKYCSLELDRR